MIATLVAAACSGVPGVRAAPSRPPHATTVRAQTCTDLVAPEEALEEGSLVALRAGAEIEDLDAAVWGESWARQGDIVRTQVAGRSVLLVPLIWAGNGAAVALLRDSPSGLCVINVWAFGFGGHGIDITSLEVGPTSETEAHIRIDLVGHHRGYYVDPADEASYVEPADDVMRRMVGTDGGRAWMIDVPAPPVPGPHP